MHSAFTSRFITLDGGDGCGKSSHIPALAARLQATGREVVVTREPGGTEIGETLREMLLSTSMHLETETLLMFAARREHLHQVIEPALARGAWVLCDRFTDATVAYQVGGRGLPMAKLKTLEDWTHGHLQPGLTLLFDLPPDAAAQRMAAGNRVLDKFERESLVFHTRVRDTYLARAAADPARFRIIDSSPAITVVQACALAHLTAWIESVDAL